MSNNLLRNSFEMFHNTTPENWQAPPWRDDPPNESITMPQELVQPRFAYLVRNHKGETVSQGIVTMGEEREGAPKVWYEDGKLHYCRPLPVDRSLTVFICPAQKTPDGIEYGVFPGVSPFPSQPLPDAVPMRNLFDSLCNHRLPTSEDVEADEPTIVTS